MPCNASYLDPNDLEINLSKVFQLIDETLGKPLPNDYGSGLDSRVYNRGLGQQHLDAKVDELCSRLTSIEEHSPEKIQQFSLELQIWWRDHKKADEERKNLVDVELISKALDTQDMGDKDKDKLLDRILNQDTSDVEGELDRLIVKVFDSRHKQDIVDDLNYNIEMLNRIKRTIENSIN